MKTKTSVLVMAGFLELGSNSHPIPSQTGLVKEMMVFCSLMARRGHDQKITAPMKVFWDFSVSISDNFLFRDLMF